jgi:hypothetical protein
MSRDKREKHDLHALTAEGMVLCDPPDREAAHRAEMEGIATDDPAAVIVGGRAAQRLVRLD